MYAIRSYYGRGKQELSTIHENPRGADKRRRRALLQLVFDLVAVDLHDAAQLQLFDDRRNVFVRDAVAVERLDRAGESYNFV